MNPLPLGYAIRASGEAVGMAARHLAARNAIEQNLETRLNVERLLPNIHDRGLTRCYDLECALAPVNRIREVTTFTAWR